MRIQECIKALSTGKQLDWVLAAGAMEEIMSGLASEAQIGGFLAALSLDRLQPDVLGACAEVMRQKALPCNPSVDTVDIVGTGGDGIDTFNVSTAASIVVAAAGGHVMKHGNRSSSSKCGSADILEGLGAKLSLDGEQAVKVLHDTGFCFLFAQRFHPAMRFVSKCRKELGCRTLFNLLGPLTNPARATFYLTGVFHKSLGRLFIEVFARNPSVKRAMVVHSFEGMDELSIAGPTHCWILSDGKVEEKVLSPSDFGLPTHDLKTVSGGTVTENVATFRALLDGQQGPVLDYVLLNAAAALFVAGLVPDLKSGVAKAREAITSGKAKSVLESYVRASNAAGGAPAESKATSMLHTIAEHRQHVTLAASKAALPLQSLIYRSLAQPPRPPLNVLDRLKHVRSVHRQAIAIMAEIKRASPSKGVICADMDASAQALRYAHAGAAVISVLTEPNWFKGSIEDLRQVTAALNAVPESASFVRPAVLLKDFVLEEYQLIEARAAGADTALLIVALLSDERLAELIKVARDLGMEPLVEVATEEETERAVRIGARFIGINNRNLHNFSVDMQTTVRLASRIPHDGSVVFAALSGISTRSDVEPYEQCGASAVLVGETLMRAADPAAAIRSLVGVATAVRDPVGKPLVKVCGIRDTASALVAARAGASFIGLVFAPSKRKCEEATGCEIVAALHREFNGGGRFTLTADTVPEARRRSGLEWYSAVTDAYRQYAHTAQRPAVVGVFPNETVAEMNRIAETVGLDFIQLHGHEGLHIARQLVRPVIRAVHVTAEVAPPQTTAAAVPAPVGAAAGSARLSVEQLLAQARTSQGPFEPGYAAFLLLDSMDPSATGVAALGGTGKVFDWAVAQSLAAVGMPFLLAGGLKPDNVAQAVQQVHPLGVDVSSGVETDGIKDHTKIQQFVHTAQGAAC